MTLVPRANRLAVLVALLLSVALLTNPSATTASQHVDVLVAFETAPGPSERSLIEGLGGSIRHSYTIVPAVAASMPSAALDALARNPRVSTIEPDSLAFALDHGGATGELAAGWGVAHVGAGVAHDNRNVGSGISIAIIDTGIDRDHAEFAGNYRGGRDFVQDDDVPMDENGHGTHVAGTACAASNGWGVRGVAPGCDLYALRVLDSGGSGSWGDIIAAIDWAAAHGIDVANLSLGSRGHPGTIAEAAFQAAYDAGVVIVAAAGNSGNAGGNNDTVEYPGKFGSVIAVAATNQGDTRASFSSTGSAVEISAPGVSVLSAWNDLDSGTNPQPVQLCDGGGSACDYYKSGSGTSMAAPHVAGVAALVLAGDGSLSPQEVRGILTDSALPLGPAHQYGAGLVYAPGALGTAPPRTVTGTVRGTVTDATTGEPITGATVAIDGIGLTSTAVDGTYTLPEVPEGTHQVTATATGYDGSSGSATVDADGVTVILDFVLSGTDGAGEPPPGDVTVAAIAPQTLSAGGSISATVTGTGFATGAVVTFENGAGPSPSATGVVVIDSTTITMTITAPSGGPSRARTWDVRVTNSSGASGVLPGGLTVMR